MQKRTFRRGYFVAFLATVIALSVAPGIGQPAHAGPPSSQWTMFHHDVTHSGVSTETAIDRGNAANLGLKWQVQTGSASYITPVVVYAASIDKTLAIVGNQDGSLSAYNVTNGDRVWVFKVPAHMQSSPAVVNDTLYVGASDKKLHAVNIANGQERCSFTTQGVISSSPLVVDPDGTGLVVYVGENGLTGSDDGGNEYAINAVDPNGAADCSLKWKYSAWGEPAGSQSKSGSWSPPAFAKDKNGRALVVLGGSSPDCAVYALDALTGERVWRFQTKIINQDNDVGAGPTITEPGVNGFEDGVAYVAGKNKIMYALNLRTGAKYWEFDSHQFSGAGAPVRSTAAILGNQLFFGYGKGLFKINAVTGELLWKTETIVAGVKENVSSPAISGPAGQEVIFNGDMGGLIRAYNTATGAQLWSYATGGFIYGSPVVAAGKVLISSSDGFLYAFGVGGGTSAPPSTTLTNPTEGAVLSNPAGNLTFTGNASDDVGVTRVAVAVKDRNTNKWWNPATNAWVNVYTETNANLGSPGATSTSWSYSFDPPDSGGAYLIIADAVDGDGQRDPSVAQAKFNVTSNGSPPETTITSPKFKQIFYFPNNTRQTFNITISGTATDSTSGPNPGVAKVLLQVKNREHGEFFCGAPGCSGASGENNQWSPVFTPVEAKLSNPGATSTNWTLTITVYDHPHSYYIAAWSVDKNNEQDTTRAQVMRFCVRDKNDPTCA